MSEEKSSSGGRTFGLAGTGFGLAALIGIFTLGPIDLARTAYNSVVGDVPLIRTRAVEYCRKNIQNEHTLYDAEQVERQLAGDLNYNLKEGEKVNPQGVRMMELWDATEDHASSWYQRWIWPSLSDK
ncbi:MAG: hypothetical protein AABX73_04520 [Nanoarchaeota archaeon]